MTVDINYQTNVLTIGEHASAPGTPPSNSIAFYGKGDGVLYFKDDTGVERSLAVYDIASAISDIPLANAIVLNFVATRPIKLPASLAGSQAVAQTAATAETDFDVLKNGVSFNTLRFAISGTVGSYITASPVTSLVAGDILTIVAPGSPDSTLANVAVTILGATG